MRRSRLWFLLVLFIILASAGIVAADFVKNPDGTVKDTSTGFIWGNLNDTTYYNTFESVQVRLNALNSGDIATWRLPSRMEIVGFSDYIFSQYSMRRDIYWTEAADWVAFFDTWLSYPICESGRILVINEKLAPVAHAGPDRVAHKTVLLDGGSSYDPDGFIAEFTWRVTSVSNPLNYVDVIGSPIVLDNLQTGFYSVDLTVKDNYGSKAHDSFFLAVCNEGFTQEEHEAALTAEKLKWDVNGDDKIGLEEAIHALQVTSGIGNR